VYSQRRFFAVVALSTIHYLLSTSMILVIKNISIEGPETFADFFTAQGFELVIVDLSAGENLPKDFAGIDAVLVLGGPMNVYEEEKYPFLKSETEFIQRVVTAKIPLLGICLGAQLLAKACGAKVAKNPVRELGFSEIRLTPEGKKDFLFKDVPERLTVFQWHEDTFFIPRNGHWLAKSPACQYQAFRVGENAYGLQFHIEISDQSIREWTGAYFKPGNATHATITKQMLAAYGRLKENFDRDAVRIYGNFLRVIRKAQEQQP